MADTTADQAAAYLTDARKRWDVFGEADSLPRLADALEAVLELADDWAAVGPPPRPAAEIERRARAAELRKVIASKLLGEEGSRG